MKTRIGCGPTIFGTYATRHLYFDVNKAHAKKYNESYFEDMKSIKQVAIVGICAALLATWMIYIGRIWSIILAVIFILLFLATVVFVFVFISRVGRPSSLFKRGVLNPAMIAKIEDSYIGLLILSNNGGKWVLYSKKVKALPGHEIKIGEKVPVTSIGTSGSNGTAIAWGTDDHEVIEEAIVGISKLEWLVLSDNLHEYDDTPELDMDRIKDLNAIDVKKLYNC